MYYGPVGLKSLQNYKKYWESQYWGWDCFLITRECRVDFKSNMCVQLNKTHIGGIGFGQKVADKKYLLVACARPRNVCYPTVWLINAPAGPQMTIRSFLPPIWWRRAVGWVCSRVRDLMRDNLNNWRALGSASAPSASWATSSLTGSSASTPPTTSPPSLTLSITDCSRLELWWRSIRKMRCVLWADCRSCALWLIHSSGGWSADYPGGELEWWTFFYINVDSSSNCCFQKERVLHKNTEKSCCWRA